MCRVLTCRLFAFSLTTVATLSRKAAASDALTRKLSNKNFYSVAPSGANKIDMSQFDDSDDSDPSDAATSSAMLPRRPSQPRNGNVVRAGRRRGQRSPAGKLYVYRRHGLHAARVRRPDVCACLGAGLVRAARST